MRFCSAADHPISSCCCCCFVCCLLDSLSILCALVVDKVCLSVVMDIDDSENMFAGAVAGMIAETIMHPFDTLNTRLKVFSDAKSTAPAPKSQRSTSATAGVATVEKGSIRIAGTRGMPSTVLRYTRPSFPKPTMLQFFPAHSPGMSLHSATMVGAMYRIVSLEGWSALYAGVPATVIGAIPATALYFSAYEAAKRFGERSYNNFADAAQAATSVRPDNELVYLPAVYFTAGALGELASSSVCVRGLLVCEG